MKILFISDIVSSPGRAAVKELLPGLKEREGIDFVIANAENTAGGAGITPNTIEEIFGFGVNVITSGDHIWDKKEIINIIDHPSLLRPANLSEMAAGKGYCIKESHGLKIAVLNLLGRVFMKMPSDCPFTAAKKIVPILRQETPIIIVDFHAEATSEKRALGWFLNGQVSAVVGTHTHVQTADEEILDGGTAYITDTGMTGPVDSVIGRKKEIVVQAFLTGMPARFEVATGNVQLQGVVIEIDDSGKAKSITRLIEKLSPDKIAGSE